jgi:selenocysteine-specific elongation factor
LSIDRVFTVAGFGAVVTGTLSDGVLTVGAEVEILPQGLPARVRGLQTHKAKIERAWPGSRVAINLAGVELPQLHRGQVVAHPATLTPSTLLDVRLQHLPDTGWPLKNGAAVKLFSGAAEVLATARVLGGEVLAPGETGWVQLVLTEPVVALKGDRFILRRPSPGATIAGGEVVDPHPRRHRRRDAGVLARLETLARGTPGEMLQQALETLGLTTLPAAAQKAGLEAAALAEALAELQARGDLIQLEGETLVVARSVWAALADSIRAQLTAYHAANPLRTGMPREELKSRLTAQRQVGLTPRGFQALLAYAAETGRVVTTATLVRLPDHAVRFSPAQTAQINRLLAEFQRQPYSPPSLKECVAGVGEGVLNALVEQGQLVPVSAEVLFLAETYARLVERIKAHLQAKGKITVAEVRDLFNTSRKYALALMEHLDTVGVTRRVGDERVLR